MHRPAPVPYCVTEYLERKCSDMTDRCPHCGSVQEAPETLAEGLARVMKEAAEQTPDTADPDTIKDALKAAIDQAVWSDPR